MVIVTLDGETTEVKVVEMGEDGIQDTTCTIKSGELGGVLWFNINLVNIVKSINVNLIIILTISLCC